VLVAGGSERHAIFALRIAGEMTVRRACQGEWAPPLQPPAQNRVQADLQRVTWHSGRREDDEVIRGGGKAAGIFRGFPLSL
jgi:hypothetical protein